jgi:hypothetical protein
MPRTVITENGVTTMTDEEYAAFTRKLTRQALTRLALFAGFKLALFYAINRAAKAAREN